MAENEVRIIVTSENRTKSGFESAKRDAEKAGDDAGKSFADRFFGRMQNSFGESATGGGGILSKVFGVATSSPEGLAAVAAVVGSLAVEVDGLAAGFAAAAAGAGAFAALALPAFRILQANYSQLVTNQNDFAAASANIATAIQSSAKDATQYKQTIADPEFRRAVLLLNDQNTVWQNLTTSQQNSLVALDNNKSMLKTLLPAQKDALSILMKEQDAWNNLTPSQQAAAGGLDNIRMAYNRMSLAFQPVAFKLFGDALKVVADLMPKLLPLANAFAGALGPLLGKLDEFVKSKGFQDWFKTFLSYVGPATSAIGKGLGEVAISFGKLLTIMPSADVVRAIGAAFWVVNAALKVLTATVEELLAPFSLLAKLMTLIAGSGGNSQALGAGLPSAGSLAGKNFSGLSKLGGKLPVLVPAAPGVGAGAAKVGHLAGGGPGSGPTVVGEYGPELVDLPSGSYVHPAGTFGGGGPQIVMHWGSPQTQALVKALWPDFMLEVRNRGGGGPKSAQIALGQTH